MPNQSSKAKRPRDFNERAFQSVALLTGATPPEPEQEVLEDPLRAAAVALGRRGGLIGGKARAAKLDAQERSDIARRAAKARWSKSKGEVKND